MWVWVKCHQFNLLEWMSSKICLRISKRSSSWYTGKKKKHRANVLRPRLRIIIITNDEIDRNILNFSLQLVNTPTYGCFSLRSLRCSRARTWFFQLPIVITQTSSPVSALNVLKRRVRYVFEDENVCQNVNISTENEQRAAKHSSSLLSQLLDILLDITSDHDPIPFSIGLI